jgi:hypothetical protein
MQQAQAFSFWQSLGADPTSGAGHTSYGKQDLGYLSMAIREWPAEREMHEPAAVILNQYT